MGTKKRIIVIGGAHGGPRAVSSARQTNENAEIILIEQSPFITWVQADLRNYLSGNEERIKETILQTEKYFEKRFNITIKTNTKALSIDMDSRLLVVQKDDEISRIDFDSLVFAGGAISKKLNIPTLAGERVCNFRNLLDFSTIKKAKNEGAKKAVIVGCGFYGVDAACGLMASGFDVTVVESSKRIMPKFSTSVADAILNNLRSQNIKVHLDDRIIGAETKDERSFSLTLESQKELKADLVVECIGIKPRTELLADAGAALGPEGLIRVDDHMATTLPNVFACGSAVAVPHAVIDENRWIPQPSIVERTAVVAGVNSALNIGAPRDQIKPFCGTLISEVGNTFYARTGVLEDEAKAIFKNDRVLVHTVFGSANESWFESQDVCVKLVVDKETKKIIGGEVFGNKGVERRIDLISVAILEGFTPQKLVDLDMVYSANAGPAFDPLKEAAMRAKGDIEEQERNMSPETLALWLANKQEFCLVDVGETALFSTSRWRNSFHLPLEVIRENLSQLKEKNLPIVLFSKSGQRSYLAQQALSQRGLKNVYYLDGGASSFSLIAKGGDGEQ